MSENYFYYEFLFYFFHDCEKKTVQKEVGKGGEEKENRRQEEY